MSIALDLIDPEDRLRIDGESARHRDHPEDDPTHLDMPWRKFAEVADLIKDADGPQLFRQEDVSVYVADHGRCALAAATLRELIAEGKADEDWNRLADFLAAAAVEAKGVQAIG